MIDRIERIKRLIDEFEESCKKLWTAHADDMSECSKYQKECKARLKNVWIKMLLKD